MLTLCYLCLGPPSGPYPSGFPTKTQYVPLLPRTSTHVRVRTHTHTHTHTPCHSSWSDHMDRNRPWRSLLCVSYIPLLPCLQTQISSSTPYSETPSAYVPTRMWETKFHTHMKQEKNYKSVYFKFYILDSKREDRISGLNGSRHSMSSVCS